MKHLRAAASLLLFPLSIAACASEEQSGADPNEAAGAPPTARAGTTGSAGSLYAGAGKGGDSSMTGRAGGSARGGNAGTDESAGGAGNSNGRGGTAGGGAPAVFEPGACAEHPTVSLQYLQGSSTQQQITGQYQFINTSDTPLPLGTLSIRYFFSNEETSPWKPAIYDAKLDGGTGGYRKVDGATLKVVPLGMKVDGADTFAELTFPAGISLEKGATAKVSWDLQPTSYDPPSQVQSNDYSYNAADTAFTVWDHVVVYQGDAMLWGCAPQALGDGEAGAGGGSGAGGDTSAGGDTGAGGDTSASAGDGGDGNAPGSAGAP